MNTALTVLTGGVASDNIAVLGDYLAIGVPDHTFPAADTVFPSVTTGAVYLFAKADLAKAGTSYVDPIILRPPAPVAPADASWFANAQFGATVAAMGSAKLAVGAPMMDVNYPSAVPSQVVNVGAVYEYSTLSSSATPSNTLLYPAGIVDGVAPGAKVMRHLGSSIAVLDGDKLVLGGDDTAPVVPPVIAQQLWLASISTLTVVPGTFAVTGKIAEGATVDALFAMQPDGSVDYYEQPLVTLASKATIPNTAPWLKSAEALAVRADLPALWLSNGGNLTAFERTEATTLAQIPVEEDVDVPSKVYADLLKVSNVLSSPAGTADNSDFVVADVLGGSKGWTIIPQYVVVP